MDTELGIIPTVSWWKEIFVYKKFLLYFIFLPVLRDYVIID